MKLHNLMFRHPADRPLTELEESLQLRQTQRLNLEPRPQLSVVKLNSTFLELTDSGYNWRGVITWFSAFAIAILGGGIGYGAIEHFLGATGLSAEVAKTPLWSVALEVAFALLVAWMFSIPLRLETFSYTHYPIRFNRKARKFYVFRPNGLHLVGSWDDLFFTLFRTPIWDEWTLVAHVMGADKKTVVASFTLPATETLMPQDLNPAYTNNNTVFRQEDCLRGHWEFIRRYMEEGPQGLHHRVKFCIPIAERRETFRFGLERLFANLSSAPKIAILALSPLILLVSPFRAFAMRTSKTPVWSEDIDAECSVLPGDPYAIQGDIRGDKVNIFKSSTTTSIKQDNPERESTPSRKKSKRGR